MAVVLAIIILAHTSTAQPSTARADPGAGEAFALAAGAPAQPVIGSPRRVLPAGSGGTLVDAAPGIGSTDVRGLSAIDRLGVTVEGAPTDGGATVTSTATVGLVDLFDGVIRASNILVVATSLQQGDRAASSASMTVGSLLVADQAYPSPGPNERVELPGLGYVVLNEQLLGGDGQSASSILVRAIRLVVTEPNLQRVPPGTELVVASAASGLPEIVATLTAGSAPAASERPIAAEPLSTRAPIDTTIDLTGGIGTRDVDNGNANDNEDNDNGEDNDNEDNDNGGAPAATPSSGTQRPIVVTVVVVVATPGATATLPAATATLPAATATSRR